MEKNLKKRMQESGVIDKLIWKGASCHSELVSESFTSGPWRS